MLKLQVLRGGTYFDLLCPPEVKDEVRKLLNIQWWVSYNAHILRGEEEQFPLLDVWMKDNHYKECYVKIMHYPDVHEAKYVPVRVGNLEDAMKALNERIEKNKRLAEEDLPDYGAA